MSEQTDPQQTTPPEASFNSWLDYTCRTRQSQLCVGLDPDPARLQNIADRPAGNEADFALTAMTAAAAAASPYAAAFKPNAAFYEALEEDSPLLVRLGRQLRQHYPDIISLCDAKRGDIGNTSAQYARAVFHVQKFHCVTVNPLMGHDAVEPFLSDPARGVFLLCLTSNPGADEFLLKNDLYLRIAEKAVQWNRNANVGLVVGATRPQYLARIRQFAPDLPLLIPGVGAQGGNLGETIDAIDGRHNRRFLINASRAVIYPPDVDWDSYAQKVGEAAKALRDEINSAIN